MKALKVKLKKRRNNRKGHWETGHMPTALGETFTFFSAESDHC